jgi:capsular exopolysaccharide synthesis family protein
MIAANLAASFSHDARRRTAIVDCDLRNPSLHRFLGSSVEPGLIGYLEESRLQPTFYMRRMERLFVMTAGGIARNPIELLSSDNMRQLLEFLRNEFDVVIMDSPPLGPISDAQVITGLSDAMLLVVRSGKTSYGSIEKSLNGFDRSKLLGLVFNDVKPKMFHTQYDYRYYRYKYGSRYPYSKGASRPGIHLKSYLDQ